MARQVSVLVVSEDAHEAELILELLDEEFKGISLLSERDQSAQQRQARAADVLVLAFRKLSTAEEFYLGFYRNAAAGEVRRHGSIVLCTWDEARDAYRLCRRGLFDDYVVYWPASRDATRLAMAVHTIIRRLESEGGALENPVSRLSGAPDRAADAREHPEQSAQDDATALRTTGAERIRMLIVDDETAQLRLIGRLLERTEVEPRFASGGAEALQSIAQFAPQLVLLDLNMPAMDGVEVLRRLRDSPGGNNLPVIVMTGSADRESVRTTREFGAVDFLVKPFDRDTLLAKVRRAMETRGSAATA